MKRIMIPDRVQQIIGKLYTAGDFADAWAIVINVLHPELKIKNRINGRIVSRSGVYFLEIENEDK